MKKFDFIKRDGVVWMESGIIAFVELVLKTIHNGEYELVIKKKVKKRSLDQNALMWLCYACIEKETGTDKNDIHAYYCGKFLKREVEINGKIESVVGGTRNLTTVEFKYFLDRVQADVHVEFGISLPNPEDLRFAEFAEFYKYYL